MPSQAARRGRWRATLDDARHRRGGHDDAVAARQRRRRDADDRARRIGDGAPDSPSYTPPSSRIRRSTGSAEPGLPGAADTVDETGAGHRVAFAAAADDDREVAGLKEPRRRHERLERVGSSARPNSARSVAESMPTSVAATTRYRRADQRHGRRCAPKHVRRGDDEAAAPGHARAEARGGGRARRPYSHRPASTIAAMRSRMGANADRAAACAEVCMKSRSPSNAMRRRYATRRDAESAERRSTPWPTGAVRGRFARARPAAGRAPTQYATGSR